jgi:2-oxoisovalerate dehydrogenase E2 component (dihydrolipoyl transacylase)
MGRYIFRLPDVGEGITEAEIAAWHVKPGDRVEEDQSLVDVMTDKATVDMSAPVAGIILAIHGAVGDRVPVGASLVELDIASESKGQENSEPQPVTPNARPLVESLTEQRPENSAPLAAPATRRRAHELGIALELVPGTGPAGRITPEDLETYAASAGLAKEPAAGVTEIKIIGLRRKIAERMEQAKRHIPHFSYIEEFDMTALEVLRAGSNEERKEGQPKLTLLPFFMRAIVLLRPEFPHINAHYDEEAHILRQYDAVHIGIATQTPNGLTVPVVRHTERRDIWDCAREVQRVTDAARDGNATRDELMGSTMTITSLGKLGGIAATPIINAPEVAIIGPNKLMERPVVQNGQIVVRTLMNLSSSFDHRIVDGHDAARFVQRLRQLIEQPAPLFMKPGY